ncbi:MAG TPA: hypothetical protein PLK14_03080, partial [Sediminibacterium sp.]|nr:hypothetical protein [Sediminibacterium sp.]
KKLNEYFLEFMMLFLAVTLGFFAENIREHAVERERETKFMKIVHEDLNNDIKALNSLISYYTDRGLREDTLLELLSIKNFKQTNDLYYLARVTSLRFFFNHSNNGFQQLKNAGGLRMIEDIDIIKKIQNYENTVQKEEELQALTEQLLMNYREKMAIIFDGKVFTKMRKNDRNNNIDDRFYRPNDNPKLINTSSIDLNELLVKTLYVNNNTKGILKNLELLLNEAKELERVLSEKYHLS